MSSTMAEWLGESPRPQHVARSGLPVLAPSLGYSPPDLSRYTTVVFVSITELGGRSEAERIVLGYFGVRLTGFACIFEHPVGLSRWTWSAIFRDTLALPETTVTGCPREQPYVREPQSAGQMTAHASLRGPTRLGRWTRTPGSREQVGTLP